MKITGVETYHLRHPLPHPIGPSTAFYDARESLLVKITTDDGPAGWGETADIGQVGTLIEGPLAAMLIGQDPAQHRPLWRRLWGPNFGNGLAVGAVDIALHDLWGKARGCSVSDLYGGRHRDRVPVYASAMNYIQGTPARDHYPDEATHLVERGFRALKMRLGGQSLHEDIAAARAVRAAIGPDVRLMADGNGAYTPASALAMGRALEELGFFWFEEPLPQPGYVGYPALAERLDIAIAAGEVLDSRVAFRDALLRRVFDIAQPDVSLCGGFAECLFMAEMARLWAVPCMPHCWGGAIVVAATIHLLSLLPDASWSRVTEVPMLEYDVSDNPLRDQLLARPLAIRDGMAAVPTGPGLGIEVDEAALERYRVA